MPSYKTEDIRNIALTGHGGSGKTSLAEALLREAGVIHHTGLVEKGNTVCDFSDEEKERGHSLYNALVHADVHSRRLNLIDTPGYPEFTAFSLSALPAVETVAVVINAATGIEPVARRMMEAAGEENLCRMIVINKIDSDNIDLPALVEAIQETFGRECLPVNLPTEGGTAVADCIAGDSGDSDIGSVADAHTAIVDQVVEVDDDLMEHYLEHGEVSAEQLSSAFATALREGHLVPICFVASRRHEDAEKSTGVEQLLDFFANLTPSPCAGNPHFFVKEDGEEVKAEPDSSKPAMAHVFNVTSDPFVGKLGAFRVHEGTISSSSQLTVANPHVGEGTKPFKISHLYSLQGKEHVETDAAVAGDIVAVAKVEQIHRDSVLAETANGVMTFKRTALPQPMYGLAITAKSRGDEQKIGDALHKIVEEDPSFTVTREATTQETVIHGMGELHLRVVLDKLKSRYNVEVETKPPKIAYRETISGKAEGHHRHKKQTGGAGQFGEVYLRIEPLERGEGFEFSNDIFGGSIPSQYVPAVEKGVRQAMGEGAIAGYPLQDIKVSVYDGKHHPVDSKEVAFITAGKRAFLDAVSKARPVLLEPCVALEVTVPNQHMGDITGDLSGKRGRIQGTDMIGGDMAVVKAIVPLAEVSQYQSQLKSVTGGQGSFAMEFSHYDPMPPNIQQQIAAQYKPKQEDD
ncbi:MAG: elongation factor G [Phycisphaeraceae bacterium]|nr:elongation factor G [Phycisphaeraceae bacterium]